MNYKLVRFLNSHKQPVNFSVQIRSKRPAKIYIKSIYNSCPNVLRHKQQAQSTNTFIFLKFNITYKYYI